MARLVKKSLGAVSNAGCSVLKGSAKDTRDNNESDMYVCLCNAISDKVIRNAVRQHQPQSMQQLRKLVPIGTDCGKCIRQARVIFEEEQAKIPDMYEVA